jgi:hypothetical protein
MSTNFSEKNLSAVMPLTVIVVVAGTVAVVAAATRQAAVAEHAWLMMIVLALLLAPVSTVRIPGIKATVTLGDIVTMSCVVLFGPSAGVIAAVADGVVTSLTLTKSPKKILYNVATCAIAMAGSSLITRALFDQFGAPGAQLSVLRMAGAVGLFSICYFLISTSLIAAYVAFSSGEPLLRLWRKKFLWTIISYIGSGACALAVFSLVGRLSYLVFVVVIGAMFTMFLFYRSFFRRFQEAA